MDFSAIDSRPPPSNVRMLSFVADDDLSALYRKALLRLSVADGAVRATRPRLGCPVVAPNTASLPEVCGCRAFRRSEIAALTRRDRTPPCRTRPCTRSVREGARQTGRHGKQAPRLIWTSSRRFSRAPRGNKKARLTLPCNPRKLYIVERPLNRQEPRRGIS
jgi:hypothetical protein